MERITERKIRDCFGSESERASFPEFCNALISAEGPKVSTLPILTTRPGPDGGIDGEWNIPNGEKVSTSPLARPGWNVYQFKTVDISPKGSDSAFEELCRTMQGAVTEVIRRSEENRIPALYVLFTNLSVGLATVSKTRGGRRLNTRRKKLTTAILEGAPKSVKVEIFDAGRISALVAKHHFLQLGWLNKGVGMSWSEMNAREENSNDITPPLVGRDKDLAVLAGYLASDTVRVITLSGANGVGKTRLALEATRKHQDRTVFVENPSELLRLGVHTFESPAHALILVIEDPPADLAERLARQTVASSCILKLVVTLPSPVNAPVIQIIETDNNKVCRILPLDRNAATQLVENVNPQIEHRVRDWIISQAAGIPHVLAIAAKIGNQLRDRAGNIRVNITSKRRQRVRQQTGSKEAEKLLELLSLFAYVNIASDSKELNILLAEYSAGSSSLSVRKQIKELEELGHIRRRGDFVAVVPAMFAGGLLDDLLIADPELPVRLYQKSDAPAQKRLLERLIPLELQSSNRFWAYMFGAAGPFASEKSLGENIEILEYLARAVPSQTVDFLVRRWRAIRENGILSAETFRRQLLAVIAELLEDATAASTAFSLLVQLVEEEARDEKNTDGGSAEKVFSECFVYWYPRSISYVQREDILQKWLRGTDGQLRRVAVRTIVTATNPPHSLSGRSVQVRALGAAPVYQTGKDAHDYLLRMLKKRMELCFDSRKELADLARNDLYKIISESFFYLPIETAVAIVKRIANFHISRQLPQNVTELRGSILWIRLRIERGNSKHPKAMAAIRALKEIHKKLGRGNLEHRITLAIGRTYDHDNEEFEGRKLMKYQVALLRVARELVRTKLVHESVWDILGRAGANVHSAEFFMYLGECDSKHKYWAKILERTDDWIYAQLAGCYLAGSANHGIGWVEQTVEGLFVEPERWGKAILCGICRRSPTPISRRQLQRLLESRAINPREVGISFSVGRWLKEIPAIEVGAVLRFIGSEEGSEHSVADVASLYLHHEMPLDKELFPVLEPILISKCSTYSADAYHYDQIALGMAKTDLTFGMKVLEKIVRDSSKSAKTYYWSRWNPFVNGNSMRFWVFLRETSPRRAYGILGDCRNIHHMVLGQGRIGGGILNLAEHLDLLVALSKKSVIRARAFAACLDDKDARFHDLASKLIEAHPRDKQVSRFLEAQLVEEIGFGTVTDKLRNSEANVTEAMKRDDLSSEYRRFLSAVVANIRSRIETAEEYGKSREPFFDD